MAEFPALQPQEQGKKDDRSPNVISVIVAVVAIIGLAISVASSNLPDQIRLPVLLSVPLLAVALFAGVLYHPFKRFWANRTKKSRADSVVRRDLSQLLNFNGKLSIMMSSDRIDTITYSIGRLVQAGGFSQIGSVYPYYLRGVTDVVANLGKNCDSFREFKELTNLLTLTANELNQKMVDVVQKIKTMIRDGAKVDSYLLEEYRLSRIRYVSFIDEFNKFGEKVLSELGTRSDDYASPYRVAILYVTPPPEL